MEAIGIFINQSPGCRRGMILAKPAAWLLNPGSGDFGLETFRLGSATSAGESLRGYDDGAAAGVGIAASRRVDDAGRDLSRADELAQMGARDAPRGAVGPSARETHREAL